MPLSVLMYILMYAYLHLCVLVYTHVPVYTMSNLYLAVYESSISDSLEVYI